MKIQGNNKIYWIRIDNWKFIRFDLDYCDAGIDREGSQYPICHSHILKVAKEVERS
tara:strand:- start:1690 stop:1857 length:168 start_codon:yes stop_codon:yes gene_type:complete